MPALAFSAFLLLYIYSTAVTTRPILHISRYLYRQLSGHHLQVMLNIGIGTTLVLLDLAMVWATKTTVDIATHQSTFTTLPRDLALLALIMALRLVLGLSMRWIRAILGVKALNTMQRYIFGRLLRGRWETLRSFHTGNLTNRLEQDVRDVVNFTTESIPLFVTTFLQFLGAFLFLFFMDRTLAVIVVLVVPFFILSSKLYVKRMRRLTHQARDLDSSIQSIIQETLQHALVIKTLQRVAATLQGLTVRQHELHRCILKRTRYSTISSTLLNLGFATGYFVTFTWGTLSLQQGLISYGAFIAFIQLVGQIQEPVRNLSRFIPIFINAFTAAERLMDLEEIPQEDAGRDVQLTGPVAIEVSQLDFAYDKGERTIFHHFSHTFPAGSVTAILGETGSGKTTLIRLLLALTHPTGGRITLIDGEGQRHETAAHLRTNFCYVPQGNTLFSGTIRTNLLMGNPEATEAQMQQALRDACADFVFRHPKGLDAPCSEAGGGLSEGQAQRIAIARALLNTGCILIFDEATSALDAETERKVLQNIARARQHQTMLFITHRPEVMRYASHQLHIE